MADRLQRARLLVAFADAAVTYPWAFAANMLTPSTGPHAPWTYWLTQPWVYVLIAPVAAVAAWRGVRQVEAAWAGRAHWWRLTAEGVGAAMLLFAFLQVLDPLRSVPPRMVLEGAALVAALGALITAANYLLARALAPESTTHGSRPAV